MDLPKELGKKQTFETLINEESLVLAEYLRNEIKYCFRKSCNSSLSKPSQNL
jgi:hypothetical protein